MGHPPDVVWGYSLRQAYAFHDFAKRRIQREMHRTVSAFMLAQAAGDEKSGPKVRKLLREMEEQGT